VAKRKHESDGEENSRPRRRSDFGHEIWGLLYIALAVLVLIALVSHYVNNTSNILGQYLGSSLATGMVFLFGAVPAFFFPAGIGYLGWVRLRGDQINIRGMLVWTLLTLEICVVLAVHKLPLIAAGKIAAAESNWFGVSVVRIIQPIFGVHRFGPYFIIGLALIVTALLSFNISPIKAAKAIAAVAKWLWVRAVKLLEQPPRDAEQPAEPEAPAAQDANIPEPKKSRGRKEQAPLEAAIATPAVAAPVEVPAQTEEVDPVEEEQRRQFEKELAAFREKKRAPIKIMTVETAELESDEPQIDASRVRMEDEEGAKEGEDRAKRRDTPMETEEAKVEEPPLKPYEIPKPDILTDPPPLSSMIDKEGIERNSAILEKTLANFAVEGKVVAVSPGPVVTRYEIVLAPGIKINKVVNLQNDISMAVGGQPIRIEAPIPGKSAVGIELPNTERQIVYFKHILTSEAFVKSKAKLPVVIGTNISGAPYVADIFKMPHMLIAGQTGSGKSVCINSIICSLLMTKKPEELRLIMIDPKKVELSFYNGIAHLLSPVVTESKEAVKALHWGVGEMERRYRLLAKVGARNIDSFNSRAESGKFKDVLPEEDNKPLPFIVILVDELADLMTKSSKDVETLVQRIAQLARAVGIHLIVATQRPSVDIITGPIKANLTSRIAFRTIQSNDSRTILDHIGAEKLLGLGDMLFLRNGAPQIERFHGAFISEEDVDKIGNAVRSQEVRIDRIESFASIVGGDDEADEEGGIGGGDRDEHFEEAAHIIVDTGLGSTSLLQRRLNLGYARAGRIMDQLHDAGIVGPPNGSKARDVLVRFDEIDELLASLRKP
jgi:DNA segregation ATPase FtsK/SpoIIIE-like protein